MKKIILLLTALCCGVGVWAEDPDKIKVGEYEEYTTWKNTALDQTLLWEILQKPSTPKILAVKVTTQREISELPEDGVISVPAAQEVAQGIVTYLNKSMQEWRTQANYFLPADYKLPVVNVVQHGEADNWDGDPISYWVSIEPDPDKLVVGRAGYWEDGARSAMKLPILRYLELYFSTEEKLPYITDDKKRQAAEQRAQKHLEDYMHAAADMVANQYHRDPDKEYARFVENNPLSAWTERSASPFARILRTVITHEFGHHLGLGHGGNDTIMARSVNEKPSSKTHVTETDGKRLAVLACYIHNNQPNADEEHTCTPYKKPHKK